ncbi:MAG: hypothetical protein JST77_06690 [Acidobacteria bacterium]|nr:hypothetical protein [Acidobacteriota bacterium]
MGQFEFLTYCVTNQKIQTDSLRRAPRRELRTCYDLQALPCPKHPLDAYRESQFPAQLFFYFWFARRKRATIRPNIMCGNWRIAFPGNCREIK